MYHHHSSRTSQYSDTLFNPFDSIFQQLQKEKQKASKDQSVVVITKQTTDELFSQTGVPICPDCRTNQQVIEDTHNGVFICQDCALQIGGNIISEEPEWRMFENDGTNRDEMNQSQQRTSGTVDSNYDGGSDFPSSLGTVIGSVPTSSSLGSSSSVPSLQQLQSQVQSEFDDTPWYLIQRLKRDVRDLERMVVTLKLPPSVIPLSKNINSFMLKRLYVKRRLQLQQQKQQKQHQQRKDREGIESHRFRDYGVALPAASLLVVCRAKGIKRSLRTIVQTLDISHGRHKVNEILSFMNEHRREREWSLSDCNNNSNDSNRNDDVLIRCLKAYETKTETDTIPMESQKPTHPVIRIKRKIPPKSAKPNNHLVKMEVEQIVAQSGPEKGKQENCTAIIRAFADRLMLMPDTESLITEIIKLILNSDSFASAYCAETLVGAVVLTVCCRDSLIRGSVVEVSMVSQALAPFIPAILQLDPTQIKQRNEIGKDATDCDVLSRMSTMLCRML